MQKSFNPKFILRTFRFRNYRLFFFGQGISLVGTWMQAVAVQWLVYRLTGSVWILGLVGFADQFPTFFLTPFAGVILDRANRWQVLLITQLLYMAQAVTLYTLFILGEITVPRILLLSLWMGLVNAVDIPARQSFVVDLVEKREDLGNAIALNSSMVNCAKLAGPSLAGFLIAVSGEGVCFLLNALSYVAVLVSLLCMKIRPKIFPSETKSLLSGLKEGFVYTAQHVPIRAIILLLASVSLVGLPYMVLMPVYAKDIFHAGSHGLGFLVGATGLGALAGAIYLASRDGIKGLGQIIASSTMLFGVGLIAFSFVSTYYLAIVVLFLTGFGMMVQFAAGNTLIQMIVDDDKRGRVMGFYSMAFLGMTPFGSLLIGGVASRIGAPHTVLIEGIFCLFSAFLFSWYRPVIRQALLRHIHPGSDLALQLGIQKAADLATISRE